jgi:hypothetical protein
MSSQPLKNAAEKLTLFFMLTAIFLSLFFALESWGTAQKEASLLDISQSRRQLLEKATVKSDVTLYLRRTLLPLLRLYSEKHTGNLETIRNHYLTSKGLHLTFYRFDQHGNLSESAPRKAANLWLMRNLYAALRETDINKVSLLRKSLDKKIEFAFGYGKDLNSIRENPDKSLKQPSMISRTPPLDQPKKWRIDHKLQQNTRNINSIQTAAPPLCKASDLKKLGLLPLEKTAENTLIRRAHTNTINNSTDSTLFAGYQWFFLGSSSGQTIYAAF